MGMLLQFVATMCMLVRSVITDVLMRMVRIGLVRMHVLVPVIMFMAVSVGMFVTVSFASVGMLMRMLVRVFVNMPMLVFVSSFHLQALLLLGDNVSIGLDQKLRLFRKRVK